MLKSPPSTPFDPAAVVAWARKHDPSRLLDTDSGGPANNLGLGDVNDTVSSYASSGILAQPSCNYVACVAILSQCLALWMVTTLLCSMTTHGH